MKMASRAKWAAVGIAVILGNLPLAAEQVPKEDMPSLVQIDFGPYGSRLPGDGQDYCYPTSATMLFFWLGANGYSQLAPAFTVEEGLNLDRVFGGLMQTGPGGGTTNSGFMDGIDVFLRAKGVAESQRLWETSGNPSLQWFADHNGANSVVLAGVSWYDQKRDNPDKYIYSGGHGLALVGADLVGSTLTINNPYPSTFFNVLNTPAEVRMTVDIVDVPSNWELQGGTTPPYVQVSTPILGPTPPNSGSPGSLAVFTTGLALTLNPSARPESAGYTPSTWAIANSRVLNTGAGYLSVIAPLVDGSSPGGISKQGTGTLELQSTNTLSGPNRISGGTLASTLSPQASSTPFGTGSITIDGAGTLAFLPSGGGNSSVDLTVASGTDGALIVDASAATLIAQRGDYSGLRIVIGGNTSGSVKNIQLSGGATLVLASPGGPNELGSAVQILTAGGAENAPEVTNGMTAPAIVATKGGLNDPAGFVTYDSVNGFTPAATVSGDINEASPTTIYETSANQTVSDLASVHAIVVNHSTVSSGTLRVGPQTSGGAGVILNGGSISSAVDVGAADAFIYTSGEGGTLDGGLTGTGAVTTFGPGRLTVGGTNAISGNLLVNSGSLLVATNTGTGSVFVRNESQLEVAGNVGGNVNARDFSVVALQGGSISGGLVVGANATLEGYGTISGPSSISGLLKADDAANPGNITFGGNATFVSGSQFYWTLNSLTANPADAGIAWNTLTFGGAANLVDGVTSVVLDIATAIDPESGNAFWNTRQTWTIATGASGTFVGDDFGINNWSWTTGSFFWNTNTDLSELEFIFVPVPEPSVLGLIALGIGALALRRRFLRAERAKACNAFDS